MVYIIVVIENRNLKSRSELDDIQENGTDDYNMLFYGYFNWDLGFIGQQESYIMKNTFLE